MDWQCYKRQSDSPHVFTRWMLEQTAELVGPLLARRLLAALAGDPLPKPRDHRGGPATDLFALDLEREEVAAVCAALDGAVEAGRTSSGTRRRGLGGFREAWHEYLRQHDACTANRVP